MTSTFENEPMLEIYLYETTQMVDQLEQIIISCEKQGALTQDQINEAFRCMHTIKGSSAMMLFDSIASVAHTMEDLFYFIREENPQTLDYDSLSDQILEGIDFIKLELVKIKNNDQPDGTPDILLEALEEMLNVLKADYSSGEVIPREHTPQKMQYYIPQEKKVLHEEALYYKALIRFSDDCGMENIRAYTVVFGLTDLVLEEYHFPADVAEDEQSTSYIRANGFEIWIKTELDLQKIRDHLKQTIYLETLEVESVTLEAFEAKRQLVVEDPLEDTLTLPSQTAPQIKVPVSMGPQPAKKEGAVATAPSMISVHVDKLDKLMNTVGELVIAEAMVTQNPVSESIENESYQKASRQLHKITAELQDMVMAIRMVPLSTTFVKMHRIVRDMCKKLGKDVSLEMNGEETEVDKNIIERISDPLMHLIRNAIDHGIENENERLANGKPRGGRIILDAKNAGSDVLITIKDDGRGLNRDKILAKAFTQGLLKDDGQEMSDKEVYHMILLPGFSTKEEVTEFSGRGVGMDVVAKNIEAIGGQVIVDSKLGQGSVITLKIPLTLAIIEGMNIRVGESRFTVPIMTIQEAFRPKLEDCISDPDQHEMVMVRGDCFPVLRLHQHYKIKDAITHLTEGIILMVEQDEKIVCLFADELLGQQQVVVKSLPHFIKETKKIHGLAGCTLLGDGHISLILDINGLTGLRIN